MGPHRAARRRPLLLADRHPAAADPPRRARARHRRAPQHRRARAGRGASCARPESPCARSSSASRAPRCASTARSSARSARACSCCSASPTTTRPELADRLADKVRALRVFPDADGPHERAARRPRGPLRQPVHALRRRAQGQPPGVRRRRAGRSVAEPLYERVCERARRAARRLRRPHGGRAGQRRPGDAAARGSPARTRLRRAMPPDRPLRPPLRRRAAAGARCRTAAGPTRCAAEFLAACLRDRRRRRGPRRAAARSPGSPTAPTAGARTCRRRRARRPARAVRLRLVRARRRAARRTTSPRAPTSPSETADDNPDWQIDLCEEVDRPLARRATGSSRRR